MKDNQNYYVKGDFIKRGHLKQTLLKNDIINSIQYFFISLFIPLLIFANRLFNRNTKNYKHTISLCGIFKDEARFLDEWIQFHIVIGIDHFYLYNNNSNDNYLEILKPYIEKGIVDLIDWPFNHSQMDAYQDCYNKHRNDTNWLTFIDIDEFICPIATNDIKSWLASYKNYPGVAVYWKQFGSSGKLYHDNDKFVIEQYTQCWPKPSTYSKMFCNMDFPIAKFKNPHIFNSKIYGIKVPPVNQYKKIITLGIHRSSIFGNSAIQINHYWGKAYDSFVENKINKSDVYHENNIEMGQKRKNLLKSHEAMCTDRDYTIQRFLLLTKLKNEV
ncbi:glycosyltransferase family 92 protein [Flavobacterium aestuarii]|uniref:glycosyltransferase family 92 protein n=1 Tax=Flavobacterium aestuarii TaxID=3149227 RepID=UPI0032B4405D